MSETMFGNDLDFAEHFVDPATSTAHSAVDDAQQQQPQQQRKNSLSASDASRLQVVLHTGNPAPQHTVVDRFTNAFARYTGVRVVVPGVVNRLITTSAEYLGVANIDWV